MKSETTPYWGKLLTVDEYDALWRAQNGVCAICKKPETSVSKGKLRKLAVDHCHESGRVRGLLCGNCNRALGLIHEDHKLIQSLLRYVEERCLAEYNIAGEIKQHYMLNELEVGLTDHLY